MVIKILGSGCPKCEKLTENVKKALDVLSMDATIEKVEALMDIVAYGVISTPTLVVDEKVRVMGRAASVEEVKKCLQS